MKRRTGVGNSERFRAIRGAFRVLLCAFWVAGCGGPSIDTDVVVSIEHDEIHYAEFESYLRDNFDSSDLPPRPSVLNQLFDQFLDERLLVHLALERGLGEDDSEVSPGQEGEDHRRVSRIDQRTAVSYLLRRAGTPPLTQEDITVYYEMHRDRYQRPESVRLHQILIHEREGAEAALRALRSGGEFGQVAARFSQVPMASLGEDGGRLTRSDLPEAFADSIFELEPGEISEIFSADYGFHIFQVVERHPQEAVPVEEVTDEIRRILERRHLDDLVASFIEEARGRYTVRIHFSNFPFDYRGTYAD